jgi:hypothetical protein
MESINSLRNSPNRNPELPFEETCDYDEAQEIVYDLLAKGYKPTVTVPKEYIDALKNGLKAHSTWIPGLEVIAGTLGREPYKAEDRVVVEVDSIDPRLVKPRFTGPDNAFHGVVTLEGPISPENLIIQ